MRETFEFITLRASIEPESATSNRYRVSIGYHGEPEGFISVPDRKRAERMLMDAIREEAITFADDDPEDDLREEIVSFVSSMKSLEELDLVLNSQAYSGAVR